MAAAKKRTNTAVIILAAGKGTRMKSGLPKVMHKVAGRAMIAHVVACAESINPQKIITVIAPGMDVVKEVAQAASSKCRFVVQKEQLGTGHAVRCAESELKGFSGNILILYGDTPLLTPHILHTMLEQMESKKEPAVVVLGMRPDDTAQYGRMVVNANGELERIVEFVDATAAEKKITLCNSGVVAADAKHLFALLAKLKNDNAKGEYYITDIIPAARAQNLTCSYTEADAKDLAGVNSRHQQAEAEHLMQQRLREKAMHDGVTFIDPNSVFLSYDTSFGRDVVIQPHVVFGTGVKIGNDVEIRSFSHIDGATTGDHVIIGPFARLRPGTKLASHVHIGNFVEVKQATVGEGAKINHLSYVGDASVGKKANIGAGTITCNYDGFHKHKTTIGEGAFIGSNTALVAPVTIGKGAVIAAGSTISENVPDDSLALARSRQSAKKGWAKSFRKKNKD